MAEQLSPEQFMQRVIGAGLADPLAVDQARAELGSQNITVPELCRVMQRRGVLTTLQTEKILKGDRTGFFYGEYK